MPEPSRQFIAERLGRIQADIATMSADIGDMKADITVLTGMVLWLEPGMVQTREALARLENRIDRIEPASSLMLPPENPRRPPDFQKDAAAAISLRPKGEARQFPVTDHDFPRIKNLRAAADQLHRLCRLLRPSGWRLGCQFTWRSRPSQSAARNCFLSIFLLGSLGSASRNTTRFGFL